jgi:hypothetical protein
MHEEWKAPQRAAKPIRPFYNGWTHLPFEKNQKKLILSPVFFR